MRPPARRPNPTAGELVTVRRAPEVRELERWPTALLTGATHGIGEATARILCPLVDVLLLHGPDSTGRTRRGIHFKLGRVISRFAGRLVTGPLAFFAAGAVDVAVMLVAYARWRAAQRRATRPS